MVHALISCTNSTMATNQDTEERKIIKYTYLLTKAHVVEVHQLQTATSELTTLPLHYRLHPLSFLNSLFPSLPSTSPSSSLPLHLPINGAAHALHLTMSNSRCCLSVDILPIPSETPPPSRSRPPTSSHACSQSSRLATL